MCVCMYTHTHTFWASICLSGSQGICNQHFRSNAPPPIKHLEIPGSERYTAESSNRLRLVSQQGLP